MFIDFLKNPAIVINLRLTQVFDTLDRIVQFHLSLLSSAI